VDCFVLHYPGLGRSGGRFGFEHTLRVLYRFLQGRVLAANYPRIHLVGHSFGGMFALFMAKAIPDERRGGATLLAPVVDLPAKGEVRPMLQRIFESRVSYDLAELEADFERIRDRASPRAVARDLRAKVRIIQGTRDTVCPPDGARALARILGAELTLTDDDHWFPDRERLARIVSESVAG
jgi:pimeloyl-ACP methyl ester carboxylesterase